ncbi:hypothetical protein OSTOST_06769, partial [Ostertagia ostertagi]
SVIYFLTHYCIQRFVGLGFWCGELLELFGKPTWILNPYKSIATYCPMAILVLHFVISFNRLTLVLAPFSAADFWAQHFVKILVLSLIVTLTFVWFVLPCRSTYKLTSPNGGLDIEYEKVFTLLYSNLQPLSPAEKTMFAFEGLLALTTLMYAITQALLYSSKYLFKDEAMQQAVLFFRNFIIDIFILPNAWTLPLLSQSVRRFYANTVTWMSRSENKAQRTTHCSHRLSSL